VRDVGEIGGGEGAVDAVGHDAAEAGNGEAGELAADGENRAIRFGELFLEGFLEAGLELRTVVALQGSVADYDASDGNKTI
jgi:hypothetical protein